MKKKTKNTVRIIILIASTIPIIVIPWFILKGLDATIVLRVCIIILLIFIYTKFLKNIQRLTKFDIEEEWVLNLFKKSKKLADASFSLI